MVAFNKSFKCDVFSLDAVFVFNTVIILCLNMFIISLMSVFNIAVCKGLSQLTAGKQCVSVCKKKPATCKPE